MDGWNTTFLLGRPIFRGYVSFREGREKKKKKNAALMQQVDLVSSARGFLIQQMDDETSTKRGCFQVKFWVQKSLHQLVMGGQRRLNI